MAYSLWTRIRDVDVIMEEIQELKSVNKFTVLEYFSEKKKDLEMVEKLLNSGYYTPKEIAYRVSTTFQYLKNAQARQKILDFANKVWQDLTDVEEILSARIPLVESKQEELGIKLNYFETKNPKLYEEIMIKLYGKDYAVYRMLDKMVINYNENKVKIIDILSTSPLKVAEHYADRLGDRELYTTILKIKSEKQRATDNEQNAILDRAISEATAENKWIMLEYYAAKEPQLFQRIVKEHIFKNGIVERKYSKEELLSHYANANLDALPESLRNVVLELKQRAETNEMRAETRAEQRKTISWVDENGKIVSLFKVASIEPQSREDYEKVLGKFLGSGLSIAAFCNKYKISNVEGFNKMLQMFANENPEFATQINAKNRKQQSKYIDKARDIIERVCEDGESIGIVLQHTKTFSFEALQRFAKELFPNKGYCEIFTSKVIDYFYDRLNSYTDSCEPENISQMLTMSEIRFIVGSEEFQTILSGKKCDIEKIFAHRVAGAYKKHADAEMHKAHVQRVNAVVDELSKYDRKFKSNEYFRSKTYVTSESGEMVEVTREMVDMAYQYAHSQKLHTSNNVMRSLINAVVNGKINNQPETERDMREMRNQAINEIYSLDELFATIDRVK